MMIAILAAISMVIQDVFGVLLVQAEARNRALLAGFFDSLMWLAAIATTSISVTTLQGHNTGQKVLVIILVTVANFVGNALGVYLGRRYIHEVDTTTNSDTISNVNN